MAIRTTIKTPGSITSEVAASMQAVGLDAWCTGLEATRSLAEIQGFYNPEDPQHVAAAHSRYQEIAEKGVVSLAIDDEENGRIAGFLLARNDVSGNVVARAAKRLLNPEKVYAWLMQVNVHPDYQSEGIGKRLVKTGLETFRPNQIPTAYVFDENKMVWDAVQQLGFTLSPSDQEPREMDYFGQEYPPVHQFRFAAPSVQSVLDRL